MVSYRQVFTSPEQAARNRFETDPLARLIALSGDTDSRVSTNNSVVRVLKQCGGNSETLHL
jgi:hypothetical protein